jgi:YHS domain-containing protein
MMTTKIQSTGIAAALAVLLAPAIAMAQQPSAADHSAHQTRPADAGAECMAAQSKVAVTATTAQGRLEAARQTNEPAAMRAAVDEALIALGALLSATEPCRTAAPAAGMDHSTMAIPPSGAPVSPRPPAAAADPHAGHTMPSAPAKPGAKPTAKPAAKPADPHAGMKMPATRAKSAAKPGTQPAPKPADPHAGHAAPPSGSAKVADDPKKLACSPVIDPENAPTTTYKGKAYYFCSAAERLRFIQNPEAYLKAAGRK